VEPLPVDSTLALPVEAVAEAVVPVAVAALVAALLELLPLEPLDHLQSEFLRLHFARLALHSRHLDFLLQLLRRVDLHDVTLEPLKYMTSTYQLR